MLPKLLVLGALILAAPTIAAENQLERGRAIYNFHCYFCHGYSGDARTLAATMLTPPPRDFTSIATDEWRPSVFVDSVRQGRPGTAMPAFQGRLSAQEIDDVVAFIGSVFVGRADDNILYHSPENGWSSTQFNSPAAEFVTGRLDLAAPIASLSESQRQGRRIYLGRCVTCHDNVAAGDADGPIWQSQSVSFPRGHYTHKDPASAHTGASPYSIHDQPPELEAPSEQVLAGQRLFQANCAFCHAADGTGENWIGSFMEPKPRNLGGPEVTAMTDEELRARIAEGLPGTSMPSWRHVLSPEQIADIVAYIRAAFTPDPTPVTGR